MSTGKIKYRIKTASAENIYLHLKECNERFIPTLNNKVDLSEYSKKIFEKAITFEAWADNSLAGLIAAYFNDSNNLSGYITSVSVSKDHIGQGIAKELMRNCIEYAKENKFQEIGLEVSEENDKAIALYEKFNFFAFEIKNKILQMKLQLKDLK